MKASGANVGGDRLLFSLRDRRPGLVPSAADEACYLVCSCSMPGLGDESSSVALVACCGRDRLLSSAPSWLPGILGVAPAMSFRSGLPLGSVDTFLDWVC